MASLSSFYLHSAGHGASLPSVAPSSSVYGDPYSHSYSSELVSLYGNPLSSPPPSLPLSSWSSRLQLDSQLQDPVLPRLKRPLDEALYDGDIMPKRARVDSVSNPHIYPQRPGERGCAFYMRTRTCKFGANCKYDHPTWVPIGGIPDWKEPSMPDSKSGLPVHPGEPDCAFFMKTGICKYGSKCIFNHPTDIASRAFGKKSPENVIHKTSIISMAANDTVSTKVAALAASRDEEVVNAPTKAATTFNSIGFPLRPGESDCAFYMKKGSCKFGAACRFNHPEHKAANAAIQSQESAAIQNQAPEAAMLGGLLGGLGTSFVYARNFADFGLSIPASGFGGINVVQTRFPQRPGETTCTYYLKTGTCKFGGNCKFHHPINRTDPASEPSVKLTLAGLPRHEGKDSCPYYMKTGTCKFGTNCKFDHPPPGEAAAKALAEAGRSEEKPSVDGDPNRTEET